ncbi:hypothetical protein SDC9_195307 [bioreactor metagenome]|uniref:Uncharacterized protein n=1 Tax=bioreactor metagenome TaxID=1076179 RepID=A0A645IK69_9ZZZZ
MRSVYFIDDFVTGRDHAAVCPALVQQRLLQPRDKPAEYVAGAEVYPAWRFEGAQNHRINIERRQRHSDRFPRSFFLYR